MTEDAGDPRDWTFASPLAPDACEAAIEHAVTSWRKMLRASSGVAGTVRGGRLRLQRLVAMRSNGWRPIFVGRIEPGDAGGSVVRGRFRVATTTRIFAAYMAVMVLLFLAVAASGFVGGITSWQRVLAACIGLALAAFVVCVHAFMRFRWWGAGDERWLVEFLAEHARATAIAAGRDGWPNRQLRALVRGHVPDVPA